MTEDNFQEMLRIQQQMSQRLLREQQVDRKIDVINIVRELTGNGKRKVQTESVLIEAQYSSIPESEVLRILDDLSRDKFIKYNTMYVELV